ncbi:hypothetical protein B0J12DRAFT_85237 [Macrophomina phaseolina]|uniref:Uncharacterized protein n=1 Tax=Macrophomina phaseolina TaxID=35725 RepID=A0ABQ8FPM0_9PEZI|nr:hypothetical protein B0J12DRAFT_85237 [Macrophomina phaseolina]
MYASSVISLTFPVRSKIKKNTSHRPLAFCQRLHLVPLQPCAMQFLISAIFGVIDPAARPACLPASFLALHLHPAYCICRVDRAPKVRCSCGEAGGGVLMGHLLRISRTRRRGAKHDSETTPNTEFRASMYVCCFPFFLFLPGPPRPPRVLLLLLLLLSLSPPKMWGRCRVAAWEQRWRKPLPGRPRQNGLRVVAPREMEALRLTDRGAQAFGLAMGSWRRAFSEL